jgi:hypothetical protein
MYRVNVEITHLRKNELGIPVKDDGTSHTREKLWLPRLVTEVGKQQAVKCLYCQTDVILHNDGKEIPHHVEHKNKMAAVQAQYPTLKKSFDEEAYFQEHFEQKRIAG